ncbi:MAG: hypothetical protein CMK59_03065 [Proteobacteria bacterium]|nr:hypothetical protein [Pseudomonadota bacterium]
MLTQCLTLTMLNGEIKTTSRSIGMPLLPTEDLLERDVYNAPNVAYSEHFALRWGDGFVLSSTQQEILLEALELSWTSEIEEQGYPPPSGTEQYLFNVYLGDTGGSVPASMGASGYYTTDSEGWPMVVLGPYVYEYGDQHLSTIPHEFFHAVQHSLGNYLDDDRARWYWEATATWMEGEVYPQEPLAGIFLFGFLFNPHFAINAAPEFDGLASDYFSYGAFSFIDRLSELTEREAVRDSWVEAAQLPLSWWKNRLSAESIDISDVIVDFSVDRAMLDLTDIDLYESDLEQYAQTFSQEDYRVTANLPSSGISTFREVSNAFFPQRGGYNHLVLEEPLWDSMILEIEAEGLGSLGSSAVWSARAVVLRENDYDIHDISFKDGRAEQELSQLLGVKQISIIVSSWAEQDKVSEQFFYKYRMFKKEEAEDLSQEGCREHKSALILVMPLCLWGVRRRNILFNYRS